MQFKDATRIAGVLRLADLETMRNKALHTNSKDAAVSWVKESCQFHLVARPKGGAVTWQLHVSKGRTTLQLLQSTAIDMKVLLKEIEMKMEEVVRAETTHTNIKPLSPSVSQDNIDITASLQVQQGDGDWVAALLTDQPPKGDGDEARLALVSRAFLQESFQYISGLAMKFNELVGADAPTTVVVTDMGELEETVGEFETKRMFMRWRASTNHWIVSARACGSTLELFLIRSSEAVLLSAGETEPCRELKLQCTISRAGVKWWNGNLPISAEEMRLSVKSCFAKLVKRTLQDLDKRPGKPLSSKTEDAEKQMLAQKIISQQEQLQKQIARDIHDAVIADISVLKRALIEESGEAKPSPESIAHSLDEISTRLREICYDLSPTDLRDWGLKTTLEALIDQAAQRSNIKFVFECPDELPAFDGSIDLHVYRILQESINNVIKYAKSTDVSLKVAWETDGLTFVLSDNGKGIDFTAAMKQARQGGMGMSGQQERVGIIRSYYPATLTVRSNPGKGTLTRLAIQVPQPIGEWKPAPAAQPSLKALLGEDDDDTNDVPADENETQERPGLQELFSSDD